MSETISFQLQAIENGTETPIQNATIQLENINLGQKSETNDEGIASFEFEIEPNQYPKHFRAKLIHDDYQEYPIQDRPLVLNALKCRNEPYVLRFEDWFAELKNVLNLIQADAAFFAKDAFQNAYVREQYNESIKKMSKKLLQYVEEEQDIHKRNILAKQYAKEGNEMRNKIMNDMRSKSTTWGRVRAERIKEKGKTFEEMREEKAKKHYNKPFDQLTKQEQTTVFEEIIESSGKGNQEVNAKMLMRKNFARGLVVFSIGYLAYDLYVSESKTKVVISHSAAIGGGLLGGGLGAWAGLACGPWAFICVPTFGFLGAASLGYVGDKVVNEWFDDEINELLKEYNL